MEVMLLFMLCILVTLLNVEIVALIYYYTERLEKGHLALSIVFAVLSIVYLSMVIV